MHPARAQTQPRSGKFRSPVKIDPKLDQGDAAFAHRPIKPNQEERPLEAIDKFAMDGGEWHRPLGIP